MNRLLVLLLSAVDALIAAAVGVAVVLAPLTLFWVVGLGGTADWGALWPAAVRIWQLGHFVPLHVVLGDEYLVAAGIPAQAATFVVSLAPLALATFTAVFAARSGIRAARSGSWPVGVAAGSGVTLLLAAALWATSRTPVAAVYGWQALLLPTLVFAVPALLGALVEAWRGGDDGLVDAVRDRIDGADPRRGHPWVAAVAASARGTGIAVTGLVAVGALLVAVAAIARGGQVVSLFEAAHVDAVGGGVLALGQLAYLPTLIVWGAAFAAGPGFAVGAGTAVSPAGTTLGVVPGLPVLGLVPEGSTPWLFALVLLVVVIGFVAGAAARARLAADGVAASGSDSAPVRLAVLVAVVVLAAAAAALLAACASGAIGPGRLDEVGPAAGPFAFTAGVEVAVGAAIALFSPARSREGAVAPVD
ncbi:hypothetical protein JVX92_06280 [Microbacterium hominis]|uniref:cell division protein PerM n=1 Tax=Microbacterium hominis TaxID=162426 RepID=UPI0019656291|nr:DUF6350 family protein [Microbacterium hominis]QRY41850.1 hypothetical protein JVX92_06280 [Microbacterium hominis]